MILIRKHNYFADIPRSVKSGSGNEREKRTPHAQIVFFNLFGRFRTITCLLFFFSSRFSYDIKRIGFRRHYAYSREVFRCFCAASNVYRGGRKNPEKQLRLPLVSRRLPLVSRSVHRNTRPNSDVVKSSRTHVRARPAKRRSEPFTRLSSAYFCYSSLTVGVFRFQAFRFDHRHVKHHDRRL